MKSIQLSSLSVFYREIRKTPKLAPEQEYQLAKRWQQHQDTEAAHTLVISNTYAVAAIAREYRHFNLSEMDLIQEGCIGLMKAVKGFNPEKGFRLITYANWWIRSSIQEFILHNWRIVKLGTNKLQKRIFSGLKYAREAIAAFDGSELKEVAQQYQLSSEEYQHQAQLWLKKDVSLNADKEGWELVQQLPSDTATPEEVLIEKNSKHVQTAQLQRALCQLNTRERDIVTQRHLQEVPATLKELSQQMSVSVERVRQLEKKAIAKVKKLIEISHKKASSLSFDSNKTQT